MSEFNRIIAIERMCAPGIVWACLMQAHRQVREEIAYLIDLAETIETCRRTAFEVGGEVEL